MRKGYRLSEETKRKMSEAKKGSPPTSGMTGKYHSEESKREISKGHKGKAPWNKGIHLSEEAKKKRREARKGTKSPMEGKHHSKESRKKMSVAHKGKISHNKGKHLSEKTRNKISEARKGKYQGKENPHWKGGEIEIVCEVCGKKGHASRTNIRNGYGKFCSKRCSAIWGMRCAKKNNTDIERLLEDELIRRRVPYTKQVPLLGISIVDFLLSHDIVIYADGDYWHSKPGIKTRDANQDFVLSFYGYKVFRFSEIEIKTSATICIEKAIAGINGCLK